jgi:hypothetical protein
MVGYCAARHLPNLARPVEQRPQQRHDAVAADLREAKKVSTPAAGARGIMRRGIKISRMESDVRGISTALFGAKKITRTDSVLEGISDTNPHNE